MVLLSAKIWADTKRDELLLLASGVCGGSLYFIAENTALQYIGIQRITYSMHHSYTNRLCVSCLGDKQKLRSRLYYGSLVALIGVALVVFNGNFMPN